MKYSHLMTGLTDYLERFGDLAVAAAIFLDSLGLPAPGEIMLVAGASLASQGRLNPIAFFFTAWCAAVLGDNAGYVIGRRVGSAAIVRFGSRFGVTAQRYAWAEERFRRFGPIVIIGARFVVVLRQINGLVAGSLKMRWLTFATYNAIGAALWIGFWGVLSLVVGTHVQDLRGLAHHPTLIAPGVLGTLLFAIAIRHILLKRGCAYATTARRRDGRPTI